MTVTDPAFLAFLEAQRSDYRRALPQRVAEIVSLWRVALDGEAPAQALAKLERCAHGLAGSGATFGFAALGDAARALELAVNPLLDRASDLTSAERAAVGGAVETLRRGLPVEAGTQGV